MSMRPLALLLVVVPGLLVGLSACGETSEEWQNVTKELGEAWDAAKAWGVAKRDEAQAYFGEKMDDLSGTWTKVKEHAAATGDSVSDATKEQWAEVQKKYDAMKEATGEQWTKARDAFVAAYEAFHEKLR